MPLLTERLGIERRPPTGKACDVLVRGGRIACFMAGLSKWRVNHTLEVPSWWRANGVAMSMLLCKPCTAGLSWVSRQAHPPSKPKPGACLRTRRAINIMVYVMSRAHSSACYASRLELRRREALTALRGCHGFLHLPWQQQRRQQHHCSFQLLAEKSSVCALMCIC